MTSIQETVHHRFPELPWQFEFLLAPLTYFKIGGPAEAYVEISEPADLQDLLTFCQEKDIKVTVLGGASNVVVADEGIRGVVVRLSNSHTQVLGPTADGKTLFQAGAGTKMAALVSQAVAQGLTGLEYFLGVPGTLGGAIYNNSHYLNHLIGEHVHRVHILNSEHQLQWLDQAECDFAYDHSRFQTSKELIIQVEFALVPGSKDDSMALIKEATEYRARTQPLNLPSSGCIFQNVPNTDELRQLFPQFADKPRISGGFLIDQAGLKGEKEGDIEVSHKHAAFFVNHGGGTARDVRKLITKVKTSVKDQFGVELQEEVFYLS
jgi:UDP-N-acetylmuramate dehydrogenase